MVGRIFLFQDKCTEKSTVLKLIFCAHATFAALQQTVRSCRNSFRRHGCRRNPPHFPPPLASHIVQRINNSIRQRKQSSHERSDHTARRRNQPTRTPSLPRLPRRRPPSHHRVLRHPPRRRRALAARCLRHLRPPRLFSIRVLQRRPHRRNHPGHRRVPRRPAHHRSALPRARHPCSLRARLHHSARGSRHQRHRGDDRRASRLHADAGAIACHPHSQRQSQAPPRRRHRHHTLAQPARGRRLQVQPTLRRPRRHLRHEVDRKPRERIDRCWPRWSKAHNVRQGPHRRPHLPPRLH